jgi:hypothetical protein
VSDDFTEFLRRTDEAAGRAPADVVSADESRPMSLEDFDDALWLALLARVHSVQSLEGLSRGVRMYFSTRLIESEVGSGGFAYALEVAGEYIDEAIAGYELLGDSASADLLRRARRSATDGDALNRLDEEVAGLPWNGVPWADVARIAYVRSHRHEFHF